MAGDDGVLARLHQVSKAYGKVAALQNIDLALRRGELLALLGPNGAGKTTALRALVGTADVSRRSLRLDGAELSTLSAWELARAGLAFVPDGARCFGNATVAENLLGAFEAAGRA